MNLSPAASALLSTLVLGCGTTYQPLGTWFADDPRVPLIVYDDDRADTVSALRWGDSVVVLDAPLEVRVTDDHFLVQHGELLALAPRDLLLSDLLFRSKYSHGRPIMVATSGARYYRDEYGDTVVVTFRREAAAPRDTVVRRAAEKPAKPKQKAKGRRRR